MTGIEKEFAEVFRQSAEEYQKNSKSANLVEDYIIPAYKKAGFVITKEASILESIESKLSWQLFKIRQYSGDKQALTGIEKILEEIKTLL